MPQDTYTLFELFCLFGHLRLLERQLDQQRRRLEPGADPVAVLEDDTQRICVYYDQGGPLLFFESYPKVEKLGTSVPEALRRQAHAVERHTDAVKTMLGSESRAGFYQGRPDFVVVRDRDGTLTPVQVGKIKYTRSRKTLSRGLRQLLEYIHFAREDEEYLLSESGEQTTPDLQGVIYTDGATTETDAFAEITH